MCSVDLRVSKEEYFYRIVLSVTTGKKEATRLTIDCEKLGSTLRIAPAVVSKEPFKKVGLPTALLHLFQTIFTQKYLSDIKAFFPDTKDVKIDITDASEDGWTTRWIEKNPSN